MESSFCKYCMLNDRCKNFCGFEQHRIREILDQKVSSIRWMNLNGRSNQLPQFCVYDEDTNYHIHDELFVISKSNNYFLIYIPYYTRLYLIQDYMIDDSTNSFSIKTEYREYAVRSGLMINKQEKENMKKAYSKFEDGITLRIAFSSGCSLDCIYCYADPQSKQSNISINSFSDFLNTLVENQKIKSVELHGNGEPTFSIIELKNVVECIRNSLGNVSISIQTNGQFNLQTAEWLLENNIDVGFSMDGPQIIQDKQRPIAKSAGSSFNLIQKNIHYMRNHNQSIGIVSTITKYNEKHIHEMYEYFKQLGASQILFNPLIHAGKANEELETDDDFFISNAFFLNSYIDVLKKGFIDNISVSSRLLPSVHLGSRAHRCSVCSGRLIYLPDGQIISCSEPVMDNDSIDNPFILGHFKNKKLVIDQNKLDYTHLRSSTTIKECSQCSVKWTCSGGCLADSYIQHSDIYKVVEKDCNIRKQLFNSYLMFLGEQCFNQYNV